jgi:hypothetical protein
MQQQAVLKPNAFPVRMPVLKVSRLSVLHSATPGDGVATRRGPGHFEIREFVVW